MSSTARAVAYAVSDALPAWSAGAFRRRATAGFSGRRSGSHRSALITHACAVGVGRILLLRRRCTPAPAVCRRAATIRSTSSARFRAIVSTGTAPRPQPARLEHGFEHVVFWITFRRAVLGGELVAVPRPWCEQGSGDRGKASGSVYLLGECGLMAGRGANRRRRGRKRLRFRVARRQRRAAAIPRVL